MNAVIVNANVGYNRINGVYTCENSQTLTTHLKQWDKFEGFVMSDWWAIHDVAAARNGVDQNL